MDNEKEMKVYETAEVVTSAMRQRKRLRSREADGLDAGKGETRGAFRTLNVAPGDIYICVRSYIRSSTYKGAM